MAKTVVVRLPDDVVAQAKLWHWLLGFKTPGDVLAAAFYAKYPHLKDDADG